MSASSTTVSLRPRLWGDGTTARSPGPPGHVADDTYQRMSVQPGNGPTVRAIGLDRTGGCTNTLWTVLGVRPTAPAWPAPRWPMPPSAPRGPNRPLL
eukprot:3423720-Pyramimonas_sp.AAC.1